MSQDDERPTGLPGGNRPVDTGQLLAGVEEAMDGVDQLSPAEQVAVFDKAHSSLAEALARTADTGGPPPAGHPGA